MEEQGAIVGRGAKRGPGEKVILTLEMHLIYVRRWFKNRVASFAKFREMQKTILRKIFREKWMRNFAKSIMAEFSPFWVQFESRLSPF